MGAVGGRTVYLQVEDKKVRVLTGRLDIYQRAPGFRRTEYQGNFLLAQLVGFGRGEQQGTSVGISNRGRFDGLEVTVRDFARGEVMHFRQQVKLVQLQPQVARDREVQLVAAHQAVSHGRDGS